MFQVFSLMVEVLKPGVTVAVGFGLFGFLAMVLVGQGIEVLKPTVAIVVHGAGRLCGARGA